MLTGFFCDNNNNEQNNKAEITNEDFTKALEGVRPSGLREAGFTLALPTVKWEDVGGLDEVKVGHVCAFN